jgi:hypothetical protein
MANCVHDLIDGKDAFEIVERTTASSSFSPPAASLLLAVTESGSNGGRCAASAAAYWTSAAGGGRVELELQERSLDVVGIGSSPGAIEICRRRGCFETRARSRSTLTAFTIPQTEATSSGNPGSRGWQLERVLGDGPDYDSEDRARDG